jgi:hypothetical protein
MDLRKTVIDHLIAIGYEQVMIRPNGNVRVRKCGEWTDAGRVGDYAAEIASRRVSADDQQTMDTGYGNLD